MRSKWDDQERRRVKVREILEGGQVASQDELVERLASLGFAVTQSSVSRDLKDLGAYKARGVYRLPQEAGSVGAEWAQAIRAWRAAGAHLLVVQTRTGAAMQVALGIDRAQWSEVAGTVAGDDTIFVAVTGLEQRKRVEARLAALVGSEDAHG